MELFLLIAIAFCGFGTGLCISSGNYLLAAADLSLTALNIYVAYLDGRER